MRRAGMMVLVLVALSVVAAWARAAGRRRDALGDRARLHRQALHVRAFGGCSRGCGDHGEWPGPSSGRHRPRTDRQDVSGVRRRVPRPAQRRRPAERRSAVRRSCRRHGGGGHPGRCPRVEVLPCARPGYRQALLSAAIRSGWTRVHAHRGPGRLSCLGGGQRLPGRMAVRRHGREGSRLQSPHGPLLRPVLTRGWRHGADRGQPERVPRHRDPLLRLPGRCARQRLHGCEHHLVLRRAGRQRQRTGPALQASLGAASGERQRSDLRRG